MLILYIGADKHDASEYCPGSIVCLSLVEKIDAKIRVQDCNILTIDKKLPYWLAGTPTLVDDAKTPMTPLKGTRAVRHLQHMLREQCSQNKSHKTQVARSKQHVAANTETKRDDISPMGDDTAMDEEPGDATSNGANATEYTNNGKVTEADLQHFMEMRNRSQATVKVPT